MFRHGLAIACLNINSLLAHIDDLKFFMVNCKIDILCINETKLDSSISQAVMLLDWIEMLMTEMAVEFVYIYEVILISVFVKIWQIKILNFY